MEKRFGKNKYPLYPRWERGNCKLSRLQIALIGELRSEGKTLRRIADIVNVSEGTVRYWCMSDEERSKYKKEQVKRRNKKKRKQDRGKAKKYRDKKRNMYPKEMSVYQKERYKEYVRKYGRTRFKRIA